VAKVLGTNQWGDYEGEQTTLMNDEDLEKEGN
jgi:hypothetical protein